MLQTQWEIKLWIVLMISTGRVVRADGGCVGGCRHMIFFQIIAIYMYYDLDKDVPFCFVKNSELSKQICNVSGKSSIKKKKKGGCRNK